MPVLLLAAADIHLGRRPARLPADLSARGLDEADLTPAAAWSRLVDAACARQVDAVLLAGDVVESLADRFRALGLVERGVRRLAEQGIRVLAVAGNHDVVALPRLAALLGDEDEVDFRVLGRGSVWESATLTGRDGTEVRIAGWSFTEERATSNPLDDYPFAAAPGVATVGLLHCDVDGGASPYAPVRRSQLVDAPVDAWLLGHVHVPGELAGPRPIGYLGSLVGLDPGEPGERGAWLVRVDGPGEIATERLPLAPLRWETLEAQTDALADDDDEALADSVARLLRGALAERHEHLRDKLGGARLVGCRVRLTGRTTRHRALRRLLVEQALGEMTLDVDGVHYFIESIEDRAAPAIDLEALARSSDPPGLLARRLLALARGDDGDLVEAARRRFEEQASTAHWRGAGSRVSDDEARELLVEAGTAALEELLASASRGPQP